MLYLPAKFGGDAPPHDAEDSKSSEFFVFNSVCLSFLDLTG